MRLHRHDFVLLFLFFKQKAAYEMRISDWSSDVCSSDLPPLSEAAWLVEFEKYKQIPEYREINLGMSLAAFKAIFFWEWLHRILGRLVGLALEIGRASCRERVCTYV